MPRPTVPSKDLRLASLALAALVACRTTPPEPATEGTPAPLAGPPAAVEDPGPAAGLSAEGRPIPVHVRGHGPHTVLIIATIHGDEAAGTPLLEALLARLDDAPLWSLRSRVVVVPVANPDGRARSSRHNAHGVDLNRNFPAANRQAHRRHGPAALSEPETRFLAELVAELAPVRILSFHQPLDVIDWDGPGENLARAMAAVSPLDARRLGSRPGSFGSWAGEDLGIPIITVELPRRADRLDATAAWEAYGALVRAALHFD